MVEQKMSPASEGGNMHILIIILGFLLLPVYAPLLYIFCSVLIGFAYLIFFHPWIMFVSWLCYGDLLMAGDIEEWVAKIFFMPFGGWK